MMTSVEKRRKQLLTFIFLKVLSQAHPSLLKHDICLWYILVAIPTMILLLINQSIPQ
jgi:hypothetical protein